MFFNSLTFLVFYGLVYLLYWITPTWSGKKLLLLLASYCFYAAWSPPYVLLLLLSTSLDWYLARLIGASQQQGRRRVLLGLSLTSNLALLGYFKYGNFLLENFSTLLNHIGVAFHPPSASIILPVGISFYTFASLSYTMDVYRNEIKSDWRFIDYAFFVSFFPHLVAGPIVRASCLLPQIATPRRVTSNQIAWGLSLVVMGLFAKAIVADTLFAPVVNHFYAAPSAYGAIDAWPAILSFSGQIYYDFCGYTLCAIGLALTFGFSFPDNFRYPYAARSFSDFWRRWHISLSSWLRDYVYISFGGNRRGIVATCIFLLATMLLGGLWHGASWMFVLWGLLHGTYLLFERVYRHLRPRDPPPGFARHRIAELVIFIIVTLTWIPFRATSTGDAAAALLALARAPTLDSYFGLRETLAVVAMLVTLIWHMRLRESSLERVTSKIGPVGFSVVLLVCLTSLFLFSGGDEHAFIYFQF